MHDSHGKTSGGAGVTWVSNSIGEKRWPHDSLGVSGSI